MVGIVIRAILRSMKDADQMVPRRIPMADRFQCAANVPRAKSTLGRDEMQSRIKDIR